MESSSIFIRYMGQCVAHVELGSPFPAYMKWFVIRLQYPWSLCSFATPSDGLVLGENTLVVYYKLYYSSVHIFTQNSVVVLSKFVCPHQKKNSDYASLHPACSSDCRLCHCITMVHTYICISPRSKFDIVRYVTKLRNP